jgi:ketosteroid isomerase-like protein
VTSDPTHIARRLAAAFRAGPADAQSTLRSLYADEVELRHIPALPSDGPVDGTRLREGQDREAAAIGRAIPGYAYDDVNVEVDGDRVHVTAWIHGTLTTGTSVRLRSDMYCTVRDGHVVGLEHVMDDETMAAWMDVAAAGGLAVPE